MSFVDTKAVTLGTSTVAVATDWTQATPTVAAISVTSAGVVVAEFTGKVKFPPSDKRQGFRVYFTIDGTPQTVPACEIIIGPNAKGAEAVPFVARERLAVGAGTFSIDVDAYYLGEAKPDTNPACFTVMESGAPNMFRELAGGFSATLAADQTNLDLTKDAIAGGGYVATRAGSITGLSAMIDAAITGAGTSATFKVTKNGTEIAGSGVAMTQAGAEVKGQTTYARGTYTFAAGDVIGVSYTSTTITNTPKASATVEIEF